MTQYFFGKQINFKKNVFVNLQKVAGIGEAKANYICLQCGIHSKILWGEIGEKQIFILAHWIEEVLAKKIVFGPELLKNDKIKRNLLLSLKTTRGLRIAKGLPVNGQRTHTNGRTAKLNNKKLIK